MLEDSQLRAAACIYWVPATLPATIAAAPVAVAVVLVVRVMVVNLVMLLQSSWLWL